MSTVGVAVQAAPRPVAPVPRGRPRRRRHDPEPAPPTPCRRSREGGVARYCAHTYDLPNDRRAWVSPTASREGWRAWRMQAIADGQPVRTHWDPMPYSPIHDDDISGQLEALLDAATVPTTIVNWGSNKPASVQEWTAYFGELFGVDPGVIEVNVVPGASGRLRRRSPPGAASITGRCTGQLARRASAGWRSSSSPTDPPREAGGSPPATRCSSRPRRRRAARRLRSRRLPRRPRGAARQPRARQRRQRPGGGTP